MAGEVLLRKGHIERDCLRRASIVGSDEVDKYMRSVYPFNGKDKGLSVRP